MTVQKFSLIRICEHGISCPATIIVDGKEVAVESSDQDLVRRLQPAFNEYSDRYYPEFLKQDELSEFGEFLALHCKSEGHKLIKKPDGK